MRAELISGLIVGIGVACGGSDVFLCGEDIECGDQGRCEPQGFCSFPDEDCDSGRRFGEHAGPGFAELCTDLPGTSTGVEPPVTSAATSSGGGMTPPSDGTSTSEASTGPVQECPLDWWDCDWPYRRAVAIDGESVSEVLVDFPLLLSVPEISDDTRFGDGSDVRVIGEAGTLLAFDIDTWDGDTGLLWVRIPQIEPGVGSSVWLYYGNPGAAPGDAGPETWEEQYSGVWHLDDGLDASSHGNDAVDEGSSPAQGQFGGARAFDGVSGRMMVEGSDSLDDLVSSGMTLTAWIRPITSGGTTGGRIAEKADLQSSTAGWTLMTDDNVLGSVEINRGGAMAEGYFVTDPVLVFRQWQFVAFRMLDGQLPEALYDGEPIGLGLIIEPTGAAVSDAGLPMAIGGAPFDDDHTFDGSIDELRVSSGLRSDAWLRAEYLAGAGGLSAMGDEQTLPR